MTTIVLYVIAGVFLVMTLRQVARIVSLILLGRREGWDAVARLSSRHRDDDD